MTPALPAGLRMLIVEDEAMVAMMVEDTLVDLGCVIADIASNVAKALRFLEERPDSIDAAILDVNLGGEKVFPVAEVLTLRGIPFVFATGYGRPGLEGRFDEAPVVQKPFRSEDIRRALTEARSTGSGSST